MRRTLLITIALLILLPTIALTACTPKIPEINPPEITIPTISPPQITIPTPPIGLGTPTETATEFPYIKYGEGKDFLNQPLLFTSWTGNMEFFSQIPHLAMDWGPALPADAMGRIWFSQYLQSIQSNGVHHIGASITPMHQTGNNLTPLPEYATVDIDGNPIHVEKPGMGSAFSEQYWMNLLDPHWQDMLISDAKEMIDMGVEGLVVDESTFNKEVIYRAGGTFDQYSMDGFRVYLDAKYTAFELKDKFNISDINSFNFRDYIIANNMQDTWNKSEYPPEPVTYEFSQFQLTESAKFWNRLSSEIKAYAKDKYGREVFFSMSAAPEFSTHFMPTDGMDYLTGEHFYFHGGYEVPKSSVVIKLSEGLSSQMAILVEVAHNMGTLPPETENLFKYVFADIYSSNGRMITDGDQFKTMMGWDYLDDQKISYDVDEAAKYVSFANAHPELYGLEEPAKVGVVHSIASRRGAFVMPIEDRNIWSEAGIKGVVDMLLNLNVPAGIIVSGDGELITDTIVQTDLEEYDVAILPTAFMMSDSEVQALLNYVRDGGTVIQISDFATHDKAGNKVEIPELETLRSTGEHVLGNGKWFTIAEQLGDDYFANSSEDRAYLPTERSQNDPALIEFKDALFRYYSPEIETNAPLTVNIRRYVDGGRTVLHLANYDYDHTNDTFQPAGPFTITVSLPDGTTPSKATLSDFETAQESDLDFSITEGKVTISVPSLYAYSIIEVR